MLKSLTKAFVLVASDPDPQYSSLDSMDGLAKGCRGVGPTPESSRRPSLRTCPSGSQPRHYGHLEHSGTINSGSSPSPDERVLSNRTLGNDI
jgi:hypothetical protein